MVERVGLFTGTASYYVRFRSRYPPELLRRLAEEARLDGTGRLLDLGSGPGFLAVPLSAYVSEVVAVDPERRCSPRWTRRRTCAPSSAGRGRLRNLGAAESDAQVTIRDVAEELFGERPAMKQPSVKYEESLAGSALSDVVELQVAVDRTWTVEQLIGLAYSTSYGAPHRVGDRRDEFERVWRERLRPTRERVTVYAVLGRQHE